MNNKILYIGGFAMPDRNAAAQRVLSIGKALRKCSYDVKFCGMAPLPNHKVNEGIIENFPYINLPYPSGYMDWISYLGGTNGVLNEIKHYNPAVVILYNHPAIASERIYRYCRKKRIKVLGDITEWYVPYGNPIFKIIKGYDIQRRMYHSLLKLDGLICISSYLTNFYKEKGVQVVEIPPLVDIDQLKWHQLRPSERDIIKIVYAGSPSDNKDRLDLILQAMDELPIEMKGKFRFEIFGLTQDQYEQKWNDKEKRNYVFFRGRLSHNEVIAQLLVADFQIFLRPDTLQNLAGFPTKFVETITSKTIPITNLSSNLSQYIKDGVNGFVIDSIDKKTIESTLLRVLSLERDEIEKIKGNIDSHLFHYENYVGLLQMFLKTNQ